MKSQHYIQTDLDNLSDTQHTLMLYGCTLEQATNPLVLKMLTKSKDSRMVTLIGSTLKKGYKIAEIATLSAAQCMLLVHYGCTFEQITDPIILKLLDENKDNAVEYTIGKALQEGYKIEQLGNMSPTQYTLIGNFGCTFEQVADPKCLEFFKKKERLENLIGALLGQGYKLEQIEDSISILLKEYTIEQIAELTPSQFHALSSPANNDNPPLLFSGASTLKSTKDTSSDDELTKTEDSSSHIGFDRV